MQASFQTPRHNMLMPRLMLLMAAFLAAPSLHAQMAPVRDYSLHTQKDRGVSFAMAVTPDRDVLSFAVKPDGKWLLTRIRGWLDKTPLEKTIDVPGWSRSDMADLFGPARVDLFVTTDGRFAICIASAKWNRNQKAFFDSLISVVDLQRFEVVATAHPPADSSESRSFYLDRAQHLVLVASTERLFLLDLPGLAVADQCRLKECGRYLEGLVDSAGLPPPCPSREATGDGRFALERCDGRLNIRSLKTGNTIGTINPADRNTVASRLVSLNGRDFLLVMEGGTKLKVWELRE